MPDAHGEPSPHDPGHHDHDHDRHDHDHDRHDHDHDRHDHDHDRHDHDHDRHDHDHDHDRHDHDRHDHDRHDHDRGAPDQDAGRLAAKVLTVSDGVAAGTRADTGGAGLVARLSSAGFDVVEARVVADGRESVGEALVELSEGFAGLVVTTGGTGFGPRDLTPEGTLVVLDRQAPGLAEAMRLVSPLGRLSRAVAGTRGRTLVLNTPGSPKGAVECLEAVLDVVPHVLRLLADQSTAHPR